MTRLFKAKPAIVALLLGTITAFAFAPYDLYPLAVLTPAGLLYLIASKPPHEAGKLGYFYGLGLFGMGVYWVYISIHLYGEANPLVAGLITLAMIMFLSLYPAIACYATSRFFPKLGRAKLACAFPAMWVIAECLRSWLFTGFPWLLMGYSQTMSPLKGYAPLLSVYGVSLMALISSGLLVHAYLNLKSKSYQSLYTDLFLISTIWIAGAALSFIPWTAPNGKPVSVSLVQGDIPQSLKWNPEHIQLSLDRYRDLSDPLFGKSDLIIWPEAAIPMTLQNAAEYVEGIDKKAVDTNTQVVIGIPIENPFDKGYFNTISVLGKKKQLYRKRHLVPFGEYVPFKKLASNVFDFIHVPLPDMLAGDRFQKPLMLGGHPVTTSICFEIAYAELNNMRNPDIGFLLTITNDAWFGDSPAQAQHLQIAQMRAIELRRPVLFASNNGITAIIGSEGQLESVAPPHVPYVLNGSVQPVMGYTPWIMNGFDPILFILICLIVAGRRPLKQKQAMPETTLTN